MKTKRTAARHRERVTDVTPTSVVVQLPTPPTDASAGAPLEAARDASTQMLDSYMKFGSLAWRYYGSMLEQSGFQWAAWWFKWDPEERLAQQISAPLPGMSEAMALSTTVYETAAEAQARWLDAWQRFFTGQPFQGWPQGDTQGGRQSAATRQ